jgi:FkbM family methyltransferase
MAISPPESWECPEQAFIVVSAPRCGSTFLSLALREMDVYGRPHEFFNPDVAAVRFGRKKLTIEKCFAYANEQGRDSNNTLGIKLVTHQLLWLHKAANLDEWLPNRKWILIRRRDVLSQAISREIATQTGKWNTLNIEAQGRGKLSYDFDVVLKSVSASVRENQQLELFFTLHDEDVVEVVYEDFEDDVGYAIGLINAHFGLKDKRLPDDYSSPIQKERDAVNEEWRHRFLEDIKRRELEGRFVLEGAVNFSPHSELRGLPSVWWSKPEDEPGEADIAKAIEKHVGAVADRLAMLHSGLNGAEKSNPDFVLDTADHSGKYSSQKLHDPDYAVFTHFNVPGDLILDVGANSGYSAGSIRNSGSTADILSFEAMPFHEEKLSETASFLSGNVSYRMIGLGRRKEEVRFILPVVSGKAVTALASASDNIDWNHLAANVIRFGDPWAFVSDQPVDLRLAAFQVPLIALDAFMKASLEQRSIVAIKVDVEGLEEEVIAGAMETIRRNRPLLLLEGVCNNADLAHALKHHGYVPAARNGNRLTPVDHVPAGINSFFIHTGKFELYKEIGVMHSAFATRITRGILTRFRKTIGQ